MPAPNQATHVIHVLLRTRLHAGTLLTISSGPSIRLHHEGLRIQTLAPGFRLFTRSLSMRTCSGIDSIRTSRSPPPPLAFTHEVPKDEPQEAKGDDGDHANQDIHERLERRRALVTPAGYVTAITSLTDGAVCGDAMCRHMQGQRCGANTPSTRQPVAPSKGAVHVASSLRFGCAPLILDAPFPNGPGRPNVRPAPHRAPTRAPYPLSQRLFALVNRAMLLLDKPALAPKGTRSTSSRSTYKGPRTRWRSSHPSSV